MKYNADYLKKLWRQYNPPRALTMRRTIEEDISADTRLAVMRITQYFVAMICIGVLATYIIVALFLYNPVQWLGELLAGQCAAGLPCRFDVLYAGLVVAVMVLALAATFTLAAFRALWHQATFTDDEMMMQRLENLDSTLSQMQAMQYIDLAARCNPHLADCLLESLEPDVQAYVRSLGNASAERAAMAEAEAEAKKMEAIRA